MQKKLGKNCEEDLTDAEFIDGFNAVHNHFKILTSLRAAWNIEQKKARKRENGFKEENNSVQIEKTKEMPNKFEKKENLQKEKKKQPGDSVSGLGYR